MTESTLVSEQAHSLAVNQQIAAVLAFWNDAGPQRWFVRDPDFDAEFRAKFLDLHLVGAARRLDAWANSASGSLALVILLDQFPRNAFRDTAHMYATDPLARTFAAAAVSRNFDAEVASNLRLFFYLPFSHSESLVDQMFSLELHRRIGLMDHAQRHYDVIRRFGRFPHRNSILMRDTRPDEQAFLDEGGFSG